MLACLAFADDLVEKKQKRIKITRRTKAEGCAMHKRGKDEMYGMI